MWRALVLQHFVAVDDRSLTAWRRMRFSCDMMNDPSSRCGVLRFGIAALLAFAFSGCLSQEEEPPPSSDAESGTSAQLTRPSLSSICSAACNNSHTVKSCFDQRGVGASVNVSVFALIEGASFVPSTTLGTTRGYTSTSCPHCQWHLVSVINDRSGLPVTTGVSQAANDVNVERHSGGQNDWEGHVNLQISDPTDASVGVCNLSVGIELVNGVVP